MTPSTETQPSSDQSKRPVTMQRHVVDWLRRAIVAGELRPGQRIRQEEIAERIGVSVAPLREALRMLEAEGQVTYQPRRGYFVTELFISHLEEIYELRQLLEERAARYTLAAIDEETVQRIVAAAAACERAEEEGDVPGAQAANRAFHFAILASPDHPYLMRLIQQLWDSTEPYRAIYFNLPEERVDVMRSHRRIVQAIEDRDADALVAELDAHRERALDMLRSLLLAAEEDAGAEDG